MNTRSAAVDELVERMTKATEDLDVDPAEVLSACFVLTQQSIAYVISRSRDQRARMVNQEVTLRAIDALKFATVDSADRKRVN